MNNWAKIWNSKQANESLLDKDFETVFMELKRLTGNDTTGKGVSFEGFREQYCDIKRNLREYKRAEEQKSIFEVGCGSGPFLMMFQRDGYKVGGVDYSESLIEVAKKVISNPVELYCGEATNINEAKFPLFFTIILVWPLTRAFIVTDMERYVRHTSK